MLHLNLNGEPCEAPEGTRLQQFAREAKPEADVVIRNGFQTLEDAELSENTLQCKAAECSGCIAKYQKIITPSGHASFR